MVMPLVIDSLLLGSLFAIASIGLALMYNTTKVFNLAHGALLILGGYVTFTGLNTLGLPLIAAAPFSVAIVSVFMTSFYKSLLHPIREYHVTVILITLALLLVLERSLIVLYGPWGLPFPTIFPGTIKAFGALVSLQKIMVAFLVFIALALFWLFLNKTWTGLAIRATIDNEVSASAAGIPTHRILLLSVSLASALTATGGIAIAATLFLSPILMSEMLTVAIAVTLLGGLGSLWGVIPAAIILGFADVFGATYLGGWFRFISLTVIIILVMAVRPQGLFGIKERLA